MFQSFIPLARAPPHTLHVYEEKSRKSFSDAITLSDMSKRSCAETPEAKSHFKALHIRALKLVIFGDGIRQRFAALRRKPLE